MCDVRCGMWDVKIFGCVLAGLHPPSDIKHPTSGPVHPPSAIRHRPSQKDGAKPLNVHVNGYPNRSQAIQAALHEKMERSKRTRLAEELAKLDIQTERALSEERLSGETWPEF